MPNPQSVLPPLSLTYVPLPLNFVQPKIKNINLREKKCWLQTHWPISGAELTQQLTTASHCWEEATQSLCSPRWPVAWPWMGLVLNLGATGVTCLPSHCLFETWMLPGNSRIAHAPKRNPGKPEEMLSQQTATVTELSAGKDKSHRGLEGEVQSSSPALLSHN